MVRRLVFDTRTGDWLCRLLERVLGIGLVPLADLEKGRGAASAANTGRPQPQHSHHQREMTMQTHDITYERFAQVGLAARRHFGGRFDQALTRAADNELSGLMLGIPEDQDPDGHLAFCHELQAMAEVAAECIRLYDDGLRGVPDEAIFDLALATVAGDELPF